MKILLGVSGGIAAYKAIELTRLLQGSGLEVQVALTASAERFLTPLTFAALTGLEVYTSLWSPTGAQTPGAPFEIDHIAATLDSSGMPIAALVIAPATANLIASFAHGLASDFLTTLYLANTAPVLLAPAMNVHMWNHPATQANLATVRARGAHIVDPDSGALACGMTGSGRLADPAAIHQAILTLIHPTADLAGEHLLITAGGTREPLDPVRFLGNRSSGRMGHALAEAALARGARVTLITASTLPAPPRCTVIPVQTTAEMHQAVLAHLPEATMVLKAAAVADFRPQTLASTKLRRQGSLTLKLEPTEDIVAAIIEHRRPGTLVLAFAAETQPDPKLLEQAARAKLLRKRADALFANDVSDPALGFDSAENAGLFLTPNQTIPIPRAGKRQLADTLLDHLLRLRHAAGPVTS